MLDRSECQKPEKRMTFRGVRSSKFRHVYGAPAKRTKCFDNVKITRNAHDSNFCAVNPKFLAVVVEVGGGGSFLVIPLDRTGRVDHAASKVSGHSRPVSDIKWNPFNDNIIASGSEDCTVKLWYIPDRGLEPVNSDLTEHLLDLHGHRRRVTILEWHPTAENILLSAGYDHQIIVWNISRGEAVNKITCHNDVIYSMSFNRTGSLLATTCKDKQLRVIDPRSTEVLRVGQSHQGTKASKVVYLGDTGKIFTSGFSKYSDREYSVWSQTDLSSPLETETIDSSSGVLFPYYDHDTKIIFLAGKGDGNVRYYEVATDEGKPHVFYLSQFISGAPQRGFGVLPKRACDTSQCEIFRFFKLHATRDLIEPISMIVPRKSDIFQDDIYPETAAPTPALTAEDWLAGNNANPILMSLKTGTTVRTYKPVVYKPSENGIALSDKINDKKFMFLSEETKPDYRPMDKRTQLKPSPQIDHRPFGADSYNQSQILGSKDSKSNRAPTTTEANEETRFNHIKKKWGDISGTVPLETEDSDLEQVVPNSPTKPGKFFTSGANTVKSLTTRFDPNPDDMETKAGVLRETVQEQKREIDLLKAQVATKDAKIRQLEETLMKITNSGPGVSGGNGSGSGNLNFPSQGVTMA